MCFSANASFGSAAVMVIVGIASIRKANTFPQMVFGAIPFIFAVQQISEGFVWLSMSNLIFWGWQATSSYIFLIFSHIVWPTWIPFSILLLEKNTRQKKILTILLAAGVVLAIYHAGSLIFYPVISRINGHHIQYVVSHPSALLKYGNLFYGLAAILPAFISSVRRMWFFGLFIIISYIATFIFYQAYIISVWCFFASMLGIIVYLILDHLQKISINKLNLEVGAQI